MKKHIRSLIRSFLLLAIVALICTAILPTQAKAFSTSDLTYSVENGQITITECNKDVTGAVTIPASINGYPVTKIGDYAFHNCTGITSIVIPGSVTDIGHSAFYCCVELKSVKIQNGVVNIDDYAFSYCEKLTTLSLGSKLQSIGNYAFQGCIDLKLITFPKSLRTVSYYAFQGCTGLTNLVLPEGVTTISAGAFTGCSGLTAISIPNSVTYIGDGAFAGCSGVLCNIYNGGKYIGNEKNPYAVFIGPQNEYITSFTLHKDTKVIYSGAFAFCGELTKVSLPKGLTCIGDSAFYYCIKLTDINFPSTMIYIGYESFKGCSKLTKIALPDSMSFIDGGAFEECTALASVDLGDGLDSMGDNVFSGCTKLSSIVIPDSLTYMGNWTFYYCSGLKNVILGKGMTKIPEHAFSYCTSLTGVSIPSSITAVGSYAFIGCTGLTDMVLPVSISSIGGDAFKECTGLKKIAVMGNVQKLEWETFRDCTALEQILLPASLTEISYGVFHNCTALTQVCFTGSYDQWKAIYISDNNTPLSSASKRTGCSITTITAQPVSRVLNAGSTAKFSVTASGTVTGYQWQYRTSSTGSWKTPSAASAKTANYSLKTEARHNGYQYRCVITDRYGFTHYSSTVTLNVLGITTQPASKTVKIGATAKFTVAATGKGLKYQWQYRTSSTASWKTVSASSGKTASYSISAQTRHNGYQYRCKITDSAKNTVYTKTVTLNVMGITTQPASKIVKSGVSVKFTVAAMGKGLKYQWQYRTSSTGSWKNPSASSAKTATYKMTAEMRHNGYQYRCKVTDSAGNTVYTKTVTLNVLAIKTQPVNRNVMNGKTAQFKVVATGKGLKYQWQYRTSSSGSWKTPSAASAKTANYSLKTETRHNGYQYRCKVTDSAGNTVYTKTITLNVMGIKTQPADKTVKTGASTKLTVTAVGKSLKYQWMVYSVSKGKWINSAATGNKTKTLTVKAPIDAPSCLYRCKITDASGNVLYTRTVRVSAV